MVIERECHCMVCRGPVEGGSWASRDERTAQCIAEYGWNVMGIFSDTTPGWAYSVGLWHSLGSPEVAVFGLDHQHGMDVVNAVGCDIRDGNELIPDQRRHTVAGGPIVVVRPVHSSWYYDFFGTAIDFYQLPPIPVVQLLWPDSEGRYPWEEKASPRVLGQQPQLWIPKQDHPRGIWTDHDFTAV